MSRCGLARVGGGALDAVLRLGLLLFLEPEFELEDAVLMPPSGHHRLTPPVLDPTELFVVADGSPPLESAVTVRGTAPGVGLVGDRGSD